MQFQITSVTSKEAGALIADVCNGFKRLLSIPADRQYGVLAQQLVFVFVAVHQGTEENARYCLTHNRSGRYKDLLTGRWVSYLSVAIPIDPVHVLHISREDAKKAMRSALLKVLADGPGHFPKKMDLGLLIEDLSSALE